VAVYFAATVYLSESRFLNLYTTTWDLGIYQQSLWSTAHGHPFFEAADLETGGFFSFLEVHTGFVLYAIVPVYNAFPTPLTLFLLQSAIVGGAAFPLFGFTRRLTGAPWLALAAAGLYLAWLPTLAGNLYDFHLEAFLPIEILSLAYCWLRGWYAAAGGVATLAFVTMEIAPVLVFFLAAFLLIEVLRPSVESPSSSPRPASPAATNWPKLERVFGSPRSPRRAVVVALSLMAGAVLAYETIYLVRVHWLELWLGLPPFPAHPIGYFIGSAPTSVFVSPSYLSIGFLQKLEFWVLIFALVGFVPLLAPRALLAPAPWIVFTFFTWRTNFVVPGFQYGLIYSGPMFVAVAYGLARLPPWAKAPARRGSSSRPTRAHRARIPVWTVGLLTIVAVNLLLSPVNPLVLGAVGEGNAYYNSYERQPGFVAVQALARLVPSDATVIATDNLFPLIDNDVYAYSLFYDANPQPYLPFNLSSLPQYVFVSSVLQTTVPPWLAAALVRPGEFQVLGQAVTVTAGTVTLYVCPSGLPGRDLPYGPSWLG
jgi:uncharacterized membrane protein